jgi:hypothetical protein
MCMFAEGDISQAYHSVQRLSNARLDRLELAIEDGGTC